MRNREMSLPTSMLVLLLVLGFPRVYGTELPMAILLIPFFLLGFFRMMFIKGSLMLVFFGLFTVWLLGGIFACWYGSGTLQDLFFHFVLSSKIILNFFFGYVVYRVLKDKPQALLIWLLFQLFVIVMSVLNASVYAFLLGFISPRSAEVFQYVYGLRALGFGLFHVDGALMLIVAAFYYILISGSSVLKNIFLIFMLPISMAMARSAIVAYVIFGVIRRGISFKMILLVSFFLMLTIGLFVTSGPFYEATELFRNYLDDGQLSSHSVAGMADMYIFPSSIDVYLFGAGKYFSGSADALEFYMGTDIGYLRILYFSGLGSLLIFILLNSHCLISLLFDSYFPGRIDIRLFALSLIALFLIITSKGLQVMPLFSIVLYLHAADLKSAYRNKIFRSKKLVEIAEE